MGGAERPPPPTQDGGVGGRLAWSRGRHQRTPCYATRYLARYVDQTFFVTEDREKYTHPVEGAAPQESIDSVEGATAQESMSNNQQPTQSLRQADVQLLL